MKLSPNLTNSEIYFYQLWKSQLELELNEAIKFNDIQVIKNSERRLKDLNKNFSYQELKLCHLNLLNGLQQCQKITNYQVVRNPTTTAKNS